MFCGSTSPEDKKKNQNFESKDDERNIGDHSGINEVLFKMKQYQWKQALRRENWHQGKEEKRLNIDFCAKTMASIE